MTASATRLTAERKRDADLDGPREMRMTTLLAFRRISGLGTSLDGYPGELVLTISSYLTSMLRASSQPPGWSDFLTHTRAACAVADVQPPTSTALTGCPQGQPLGRDAIFIPIQAP